jgi:hypothetical protein
MGTMRKRRVILSLELVWASIQDTYEFFLLHALHDYRKQLV